MIYCCFVFMGLDFVGVCLVGGVCLRVGLGCDCLICVWIEMD